MTSLRHALWVLPLLLLGLVAVVSVESAPEDPLPSWNEGPAKTRIVDFVTRVTTPGGPEFVAPEARVATFDNDGTLWAEQPIYTQLLFALDRVKALAPAHPEWKTQEPFRAILEDDKDALASMTMEDIVALVSTTHAGITSEAFHQVVSDWLATARHPKLDQPYTRCVYQPMLELLDYLRAQDFQVWICSGGGVDFMRVFAEEVYGVPPAQAIGSTGKSSFAIVEGRAVLQKEAGIARINDKAGKPVGIDLHIGRRPILAVGNSDGDFEMLEYATVGADGPSLGVFVHHDDAEREWAYDRESHVGKLDRGLDEAAAHGWEIVSMKSAWKRVFPFESD